jgi:GGDEF domain-containing protein
MISIRESVVELERCHARRAKAVDCYAAALQNAAQYAVDLDREITAPYKNYLASLAQDVASGRDDVLDQSRSTFRALLRDFRDKAAAYLQRLREELSATARALQETLAAMVTTDGDYETNLRASMSRLRQLAASPAGQPVRVELTAAADAIESGFEEMRKQHGLTVSQFLVEIQMLHRRLDALEAAATVDKPTMLLNRAEIEERVRLTPPGGSLLMAKVSGIRLALSRYPADVSAQLLAAFTKRLRNMIPADAVTGRWAEEDFLAILKMTKNEALGLSNRVAEQLSGAYSCLHNGSQVRPALRLTVAVAESGGDRPVERVRAFLAG